MISPVTTDRNTPAVEAVPEDNTAALHRLLDAMRSDAVSQRNKGTRFERLALDFFRYDRTYADVFSWVETYSDWAKAHPELGVDGRDIGIDLVATLNDSYTNYGDTGGGYGKLL